MHTNSKLALAGLAATLLMALAVTSASANTLSVTAKTFRAVWTPISFAGEGGIINPTIRCNLTLEGSFHSGIIRKTLRALAGHITRTAIGNETCTGGHFTILQTSLPWHLTYLGFSGTLPTISRVRIGLRAEHINLEILGLQCLYTEAGGANEGIAGESSLEVAGGSRGISADETIRIRLFTGTSSSCPPEGRASGLSKPVTALGTTTVLTIRLI